MNLKEKARGFLKADADAPGLRSTTEKLAAFAEKILAEREAEILKAVDALADHDYDTHWWEGRNQTVADVRAIVEKRNEQGNT